MDCSQQLMMHCTRKPWVTGWQWMSPKTRMTQNINDKHLNREHMNLTCPGWNGMRGCGEIAGVVGNRGRGKIDLS